VIAAFTCREEAGKMGASLLDLAARGVDQAFCVDGSHPIGTVIDRSLGQTVWTLEVRGRRAHSALNPEQGVNAIAVASEIVAALPLGRQEHGGSLGVASIVGGALVARMDSGLPAREALARTPTNSVPDVALLRGEARGYTDRDVQETLELVRHMALGVCIGHGATFIFSPDEHGVPPMPGGEVSRGVELLRTAAREVPGVEIDVHGSPSTLEANYLARLCDTVAVSSGGREPHQTSESIEVRELTQLTELLTAVVRAGCLAEG
jgi:tripeptide aminopeptidase